MQSKGSREEKDEPYTIDSIYTSITPPEIEFYSVKTFLMESLITNYCFMQEYLQYEIDEKSNKCDYVTLKIDDINILKQIHEFFYSNDALYSNLYNTKNNVSKVKKSLLHHHHHQNLAQTHTVVLGAHTNIQAHFDFLRLIKIVYHTDIGASQIGRAHV